VALVEHIPRDTEAGGAISSLVCIQTLAFSLGDTQQSISTKV